MSAIRRLLAGGIIPPRLARFLIALLAITMLLIPLTATATHTMAVYSYGETTGLEKYAGGWDVKAEVGGIYVDYTVDEIKQRLGVSSLPGEDQLGKVCRRLLTEDDEHLFSESAFPGGGVFEWQVDVDPYPLWLWPDLDITISNVRHVNWRGEKIPLEQPAETLKVVSGDHVYYYDLHLFAIDLEIRSVADAELMEHWEERVWEALWYTDYHHYEWAHETAATIDCHTEDGAPCRGLPFKGSVFVRFYVKPSLYRIKVANETFLYDADAPVFVAVMTCWVAEDPVAYSPTPEPEEEGWVQVATAYIRNYPNEGQALNMYVPGTLTTIKHREWSKVSPDEAAALPSEVWIAVPAELQCGMYAMKSWTEGPVEFEWWWVYNKMAENSYDNVMPVDVAVRLTIMVEVLTIHNFVLYVSPHAPELEIQEDYIDYAERPHQQFWEDFLESLRRPEVLVSIALLGIAIIILLLMAFGGSIKLMIPLIVILFILFLWLGAAPIPWIGALAPPSHGHKRKIKVGVVRTGSAVA